MYETENKLIHKSENRDEITHRNRKSVQNTNQQTDNTITVPNNRDHADYNPNW